MYLSRPVLTCAEAIAFERSFLSSEEAEWNAMEAAGVALAQAVYADYRWWREWPLKTEVIVFAGKGHNAADALLATMHLKSLKVEGTLKVTVVWCFGKKGLRPLLRKTRQLAIDLFGDDLTELDWSEKQSEPLVGKSFDLSFDGIVGMQFSGEWRGDGPAVVSWMNTHPEQLGFRVAVDLPSGMGDEASDLIAEADLTYATGVLKYPALKAALRGDIVVGRLRYLDVGFFNGRGSVPLSDRRFIGHEMLHTISPLRKASGYKGSYGHVGLLGGSSCYPGAILLATRAALKAGAGLVTGFVPEALSLSSAPAIPEAIWRGLVCSDAGVFESSSIAAVLESARKLDALVVGPGMLTAKGGLDGLRRIVTELALPMVLDAGALVPELGRFLKERPCSFPPVVLTPHIGELRRIAGDFDEEKIADKLIEKAREWGVVMVLKGSVTRISKSSSVLYALAGNPVLARGGSGDMLAGILGARLALPDKTAFVAAQEAVVWHGAAADCLARARGEVAVCASELLDFLGSALREVHR